MKRLLSRIVGAGCLAALLAAPVLAQEDASQPNRNLELAEDMEIMGRLLEEALEMVYQDPKIERARSVYTQNGIWLDGLTGSGSTVARLADHIRSPLSSYLEDHGIVFQIEAPLPRQVEGGDSGASKRDDCPFLSRSPWERMQMRIEGRRVSKTSCTGCHKKTASVKQDASPHTPPTTQLVDALIQVLAENGYNVRHLKADEQLVVGITFRVNETDPISSIAKLEPSFISPSSLYGHPSLVAKSRVIFEQLLGKLQRADLLLNAREYTKAIEAYGTALEDAGIKAPSQHAPDARMRPAYKQLIKAHVGAGNLEEAQKLIAILRASEAKATPDEKSPPPLPSRLVVSATKAQLDQVAGGEISREEFAKQAKVQFLEGRGTEPSKQAKGDWKDLIDPKTGGILYDRLDSVPVPKFPRN